MISSVSINADVKKKGSLHKRIQENITNKKLKEVAAKKGIDLYVEDCFVERIVMGKEVEATTVEAIIGAVWYDSHEDLATIRTLLDRLLDTNLVMEHQAFTSIAGRI
jgi:dsRNA-specific ribonuclease